MRGWMQELVKWTGRRCPAEESRTPTDVQVHPPAPPSPPQAPELLGLDVDNWLEEKSAELNGDWMLARLSGVFRGENTAARQAAAALLRPTDELWLELAPEQIYSNAAVRIRIPEGDALGYLEPSLGEAVSRQIKGGRLVRCFVYKVTLNDRQLPSAILLALLL